MLEIRMETGKKAALCSTQDALALLSITQQEGSRLFSPPSSASHRSSAEPAELRLVFKAHNIHSVEQTKTGNPSPSQQVSSLEAFLRQSQPHLDGSLIEAGLCQRLDFLTAGLIIQACSPSQLQDLRQWQREGRLTKTYLALCDKPPAIKAQPEGGLPPFPFELRSRFRSFGPKGQEVRVVLPEEEPRYRSKKLSPSYCSKILQYIDISPSQALFWVEITKGFRHQIRAHLARLGYPIVNDPLYNPQHSEGRFNESFGKLQLLCYSISLGQTRYTLVSK